MPADHFLDLIGGKPCIPGPLYSAVQQFIPLLHSAFDLGVAAAPESFVIDRHGRVRYKQVGVITADDWERKIKPLMDRLRAES